VQHNNTNFTIRRDEEMGGDENKGIPSNDPDDDSEWPAKATKYTVIARDTSTKAVLEMNILPSNWIGHYFQSRHLQIIIYQRTQNLMFKAQKVHSLKFADFLYFVTSNQNIPFDGYCKTLMVSTDEIQLFLLKIRQSANSRDCDVLAQALQK
jgi:hypothetical protein